MPPKDASSRKRKKDHETNCNSSCSDDDDDLLKKRRPKKEVDNQLHRAPEVVALVLKSATEKVAGSGGDISNNGVTAARTTTTTASLDSAIQQRHVGSVLNLLHEGCTVPFISRYRKEATGSMSDTTVIAVRNAFEEVSAMWKRRLRIQEQLSASGQLSAAIQTQLKRCATLTEVEEVYAPYKPKRKTKATAAMERGLAPLAELLVGAKHSTLSSADRSIDWMEMKKKISENNTSSDAKVGSMPMAELLQGARDILAEQFSDNAVIRKRLREEVYCLSSLQLQSEVVKARLKEQDQQGSSAKKGSDDDIHKYRDFFDRKERLQFLPAHRYLAMARGTKAGFLRLKLLANEDKALCVMREEVSNIINGTATTSTFGDKAVSLNPNYKHFGNMQVVEAIEDSFKRLVKPSLEGEVMRDLKKRADEEAVVVFAKNLKGVLLEAPLAIKMPKAAHKQPSTSTTTNNALMAIDPGFRTGAKVVVLSATGELLHHEQLFLLDGIGGKPGAPGREKLAALLTQFSVGAIAVGNGTAGRETKQAVLTIVEQQQRVTAIFSVDESGASIYSVSPVAQKEFPGHDPTVRGAVSIGRRLQDPLAELVKLDPKSIGVGQYQHDVDQTLLKRALDEEVMLCVNAVGVDINTAGVELLQYVAGVGPKLAGNIVAYRKEKEQQATSLPISSRQELLKVPKLGAKTFEQCAGFIRVLSTTQENSNPLDATGIHPEHYWIADEIARYVTAGKKDGAAALFSKNSVSSTTEALQGLIDHLKKTTSAAAAGVNDSVSALVVKITCSATTKASSSKKKVAATAHDEAAIVGIPTILYACEELLRFLVHGNGADARMSLGNALVGRQTAGGSGGMSAAKSKLTTNVHNIKGLQKGMLLSGTITNVTNFGAFVDIGVHRDGLVHCSAPLVSAKTLSANGGRWSMQHYLVRQEVVVQVLSVEGGSGGKGVRISLAFVTDS